MKKLLVIAGLLPTAALAEPNADLLLELWRSYAVAAQTGAETAIAERRAALFSELDRCEGGMARPNCWDRTIAAEIFALADAFGPSGSETGPGEIFPVECDGLAPARVAALPVTPRLVVLQIGGEAPMVVQQVPDNEFRFEGEGPDGPVLFGWQGDYAALTLSGREQMLCGVMVGDE